MDTKIFRFGALLAAGMALAVLAVLAARPAAAQAMEDPVVRGEYLASVAGCLNCHTPLQAAYNNPETLTLDQIKTLSMREEDAADTTRLLAGGRVFPLGPAGIVISANITPDMETGIGSWTNDEIKTAIRTGLRPDGRVLFPLMPYPVYNSMDEHDLDAIVAYLRSVPAVVNPISKEGQVSTEGMPSLPLVSGVAPDPADEAAYGKYLVNSVLACTDCHTPVDPSTGAPIFEKFLGGGQPFEGPWGIVYGGNITPDETTGLGAWSEADIKRVLVSGIRPDGRRVIVMPWQGYSNLNAADMDAVVAYLRNGVPAVTNEVPATSVNPDIAEIIPLPTPEPEAAAQGASLNTWIIVGVGVAVLAIILFFATRRKKES